MVQMGAGIGLAGAGSKNSIDNAVNASVRSSSINVHGDASVVAQDNSVIEVNAGGLGIWRRSGGANGFGASLGTAFANNEIKNNCSQVIVNSNVTATGKPSR
ncbi:MAG: hypothetical protein U0930_04400 [Pirellulales bacterium]